MSSSAIDDGIMCNKIMAVSSFSIFIHDLNLQLIFVIFFLTLSFPLPTTKKIGRKIYCQKNVSGKINHISCARRIASIRIIQIHDVYHLFRGNL